MKENKLNNLLANEEEIDLTLSYSRVSDFDRNGPISLVRRSIVDNEGVKHGSLVDILLTDRLTNSEEFKKDYVVADIIKPTAMLGTLTDIILKNYMEIPNTQEVLNICKINNLWKRQKEDTIISNFDNDEFWNYLKIKFETKDKIVISNEEYFKAKESVDILLSHEFTKDLFYNDLENHYQVKFNIKYKYFYFRGIIDKLTIDRDKKIVYIEDIKTGESKAVKFIESFIKYRYYFQEAIYQKAFEDIKQMFNLDNDYKLAPFKFIYMGKTESNPLVFTVSKKWSDAAVHGFTTKNGFTYRGLDENIELIYYHWKNKIYDFDKEIYENNGIINLKDDFIVVDETK